MPAKAYSLEDGNLSNKPIITSQTRTYNDIDLSFKKKTTGDVFKKTDAAAVKQSIKNILLTNRFEKPFSPFYGGELGRFLFSLDTEFDEEDIMLKKIKNDIEDILIPRVKDQVSEETKNLFRQDTTLHINPTGKFVIGGPHGDTGLTLSLIHI